MAHNRSVHIPAVMAAVALALAAAHPVSAQGLVSGPTPFSLVGFADAIRYPQDALARHASGSVALDLVVRADGKVALATTDSTSQKVFADAVIEGVSRMDFRGWSVGAPETSYTFGIAFIPGGSADRPLGWVTVERLRPVEKTQLSGGGGPQMVLFPTGMLAGSTVHDAAVARQMKLPAPDEFIPVEEEPKWEQGDLQRRINYPEYARRNNQEGTTIVRALVGTDGTVVKYLIDQSSGSPDLDYTSVEAVAGTAFVPARNKEVPVAVWMQIPVNFKLN